MRKSILIILVLFVAMQGYASDYFACKVVLNDSTVLNGYSKKPNMMDKYFKLRKATEKTDQQFTSDQVKAIFFYDDQQAVTCYEPVFTYRNYSNKTPLKTKSWLQLVSTGYVKLYLGYQPGTNSPNMNLWYCKKTEDQTAYFITMKYSGGIVFTVGASNDLIKNASIYFADYPVLVEKIKQKQFKTDNLSALVEEYNAWKGISK